MLDRKNLVLLTVLIINIILGVNVSKIYLMVKED